jgi:P4 family phage/plasmid primase-like protien
MSETVLTLIQTPVVQFKDLNSFLKNHKKNDTTDKSSITHTRMGDKDLNVYSGSYVIPKEELEIFYKLYYKHIFEHKNKEYLTEKQSPNGGAMVVDFDFRYNENITSRQHTTNHINDMIYLYLEELKKYFIFDNTTPINVFIFEKPNVNICPDKNITKDGIHMLIGIKIDYTMQLMIRESMLGKLKETWSDLPLTNDMDGVLDVGITKGTTPWTLYGSRKPHNEAYSLTHHIVAMYDTSDGEFKTPSYPVSEFNLKTRFQELSVQYEGNPKFEINPTIQAAYNAKLKQTSIKHPKNGTKKFIIIDDDEDNEIFDEISHNTNSGSNPITISDIVNIDILDKAIDNMIKYFENKKDYESVEAHQFAQILPEKYYEPCSHDLNVRLAFALKKTDDKLFLSWVKVRSKASDFNFNDIPQLLVRWKGFNNSTNSCVTKRSIMYWAKTEMFDEYEKIKSQTIDSYVEEAIESRAEYDFAKVLKQMFKDNYICTNYKQQTWYVFINHKWNLDSGLSLRNKISTDLYELFQSKQNAVNNELHHNADDDDVKQTYLKDKLKRICEAKHKLKKTCDKGNIMRESAELFYDGLFNNKINTNKYLLCFTNGVIDFKDKVFRDGAPEDYITMSTNIEYHPINLKNPSVKDKVDQIRDFMHKLFPIADLHDYMWDHLASCLIGTNKNHSFNVYHGSGSNGKSMLTDLMGHTLGEYKGLVPLALLTDKRGKIGGTSDEILKLRGIRYAVIQEPSKSDKLNEGTMKELTGGDPIQARGLYSESVIFETQFNLVVCTNNLFDIESNDDGTWRRIKKVDFLSKFISEGETHTDETKYVYPKDPDLKEKFPEFAPVFASMLVERAFITDGIVRDCDTVINASKKYRNGQDLISSYLAERIEATTNVNDKLGKVGLVADFELWFRREFGDKKKPKSQELYSCMNKKFGELPPKGRSWTKVRLVQQEEDKVDEISAINH